MAKLRKDLQNPQVQEEIRQAEEIALMNAEISQKLDSRSKKEKIAEWNLVGEE